MEDMLALFFPLAYEHLKQRMQELHERHPELQFNFAHSIYPACAMNMGPQSISFLHADGNNYPGLPCSIDAFGEFDWKLGGHIVLFTFKVFVRFPPGCVALLSSAGVKHGNTPIMDGETRYSFTQFVPGDLMRWIAYGCRPAGGLTSEEREALESEGEEGWDAQRRRLSNFYRLRSDRRLVFRKQ